MAYIFDKNGEPINPATKEGIDSIAENTHNINSNVRDTATYTSAISNNTATTATNTGTTATNTGTIANESTPGSRTAHVIGQVNVAARAAGDAKGQQFNAGAPYQRCSILAMKPGAGADKFNVPVANVGTIYIITSPSDTRNYALALSPGSSIELPPNCDLADWYLVVDNASDGIIIMYTT